MRWAVLPEADRIMREHEDDGKLHQGAQPDGRLHIVGKDEEGRSEGANLGQCETIQDRAHGVLADAEVQIAAARRVSFLIAGTLECKPRLGGRGEIGRAADQPWVMRSNGVEYLARRVARGKAFRVGGENRKFCVPVWRKVAPLHVLNLVG